MPLGRGLRFDRTHTTPLLTRSPVELIDRAGANHLHVEYNPLIPAAKRKEAG
jgi:hypothetical protein